MTADLYYTRFILVPGTHDLYIIGGSKDSEGEHPTNKVAFIRGKEAPVLKKSLSVPRSKVALTIGKVHDSKVPKNYIFAIGG